MIIHWRFGFDGLPAAQNFFIMKGSNGLLHQYVAVGVAVIRRRTIEKTVTCRVVDTATLTCRVVDSKTI